MAITRIECGGKDFYFKMTRRALRAWEKRGEGRSKNKLFGLSAEDEMDLYLACLQDGAKLEGEKFKMSVNDLFYFDAEHDLISKIDEATEGDIKK